VGALFQERLINDQVGQKKKDDQKKALDQCRGLRKQLEVSKR
jgi:hypothetical protein